VGFFDHMLELLDRHGLLGLQVQARGDLHVDAHHTVEDVGICLGEALAQALADKRGIRRYGHAVVPMDEALAEASIDLSGRPFLVFRATFRGTRIGTFPVELVEEFFRALSSALRCNLHIEVRYGTNNHHVAEAIFKGVARALRAAMELDPRNKGRIPSTKGSL
jgi:imidazoleglycerol-phosphate dehydratase